MRWVEGQNPSYVLVLWAGIADRISGRLPTVRRLVFWIRTQPHSWMIMILQIAVFQGLLSVSIALLGAYFAGLAGWIVIQRPWFEVALSRRQWLYSCSCAGFLSGLIGGLVGADLATDQFLPWVTQELNQVMSLHFVFV